MLDRVRGTDMDCERCVQPNPGMVMLVVVVSEEPAAELSGILNGPEPVRKNRTVLQCLVVNANAEGGCGSSPEAVLYERWRFVGPPEPLYGERL